MSSPTWTWLFDELRRDYVEATALDGNSTSSSGITALLSITMVFDRSVMRPRSPRRWPLVPPVTTALGAVMPACAAPAALRDDEPLHAADDHERGIPMQALDGEVFRIPAATHDLQGFDRERRGRVRREQLGHAGLEVAALAMISPDFGKHDLAPFLVFSRSQSPLLDEVSRGPSRHILGISAYYHDSAACLLRDGEDRCCSPGGALHPKEGDAAFPRHAVGKSTIARSL